MKITIFGAGGRMGRTIARLAAEAGDISLVGAVDAPGSPAIGDDIGGVQISEDAASALLGADVAIDFTVAAAFAGSLRASMSAGVAFVSGTTRLSADDRALIDKAAGKIGVLWAPNMSVGVQVVAKLIDQAARSLGDAYDIEIVEAHHNKKVDAPSGTATFLLEAAQHARGSAQTVFGREGQVGARGHAEIGVHAIRGGGIVGDHTCHLIGEYDRIEITHRAMSRDLFAEGALRAARFVAGKPAGRYTLADIV